MKFRYRNKDEMKDSGVEWLGKIPQNWNIKKTKHLFILKNSKSFDENPVVLSLTQKGLKIRDISKNEGQLASSYIGYIKVNKNDLILNPMDLISGYADKSDIEGVISPAYIIFTERENSKLCNNYYKYYFQMHYHNNFLFPWGEGVSFQHRWTLKNETFLNLPIIYSNNIFEQKKIGDFLDKKTAEFDSIISKKEALIEKLEEAKKSLISEVVTGKVKVVKTSDGYELVQRKKEEMKNSGVEWLGYIPREWNIKKIKYVSSLKSGESITSDNIRDDAKYPVYGGNGLRGYTDRFTHKGKYILIGRQGALCGNINYTNDEFWASEHAIVVNPLLKVDTLWLGELLRSMNLNQYSISAAQPGLAVGMIENLSIPFIEYNQQVVISDFINKKILEIKTTVEKTKQQIEKLKEAKQSLISEAVTGKIEILE
ncbi:restriction endonuclease subunit S [Clostridium perfringens]|uniref:restriction endonuclease subunit S n=1 Tax=Clostridium perfringens TaxID=1502 RepID=UPI0024BC2445|nr:restriction endonuclease subunit S [Clostridium perfringens]MDM0643073.1 restriction endonuclease subunit S [Clostridium perfringens]MDM0647116.1 restriction endonuclease subunit S [Clostridium perfringens]MDU7548681.1 restriction endonuclease subunit S [Clostridium perfringens]MDV5090182.1 restriction endonuclease subunit S [Clostridium perfringens]MDV5108232.1 restriction endonuclease subunit S [Clostridium perfringens]